VKIWYGRVTGALSLASLHEEESMDALHPRAAPSIRGRSACAAVAVTLSLLGCHRNDTTEVPAPAPDLGLAGAWAGTWTGVDPTYGTLTGAWEAEVEQVGTAVVGRVYLSGDSDCRDASLVGASQTDGSVVGRLDRAPCKFDRWSLTALGIADRKLGGLWAQPGAQAAGTFTGYQTARAGGPRVRFFSPPSGAPGTLVTVVGAGFDAAKEPITVDLGGIPVDAAPGGHPGILTFRLPAGLAPGPVFVSAPGGVARSPFAFETDPGNPRPVQSAVLGVYSHFHADVVFGPDGRRVYIGNGDTSSNDVGLHGIDTRSLQRVTFTPVQLTALAMAPDGRSLWGADQSGGFYRIDPGTGSILGTGNVSAGSSGAFAWRLAPSPDGRVIVAASCARGGPLMVLDAATLDPLATVALSSAQSPCAVAAAPGGARALVALAGDSAAPGELRVLDLDAAQFVGSAVSVVRSPTDVAVTPDGAKAYVAGADASLTAVDLDSRTGTPVSLSRPAARLAMSPDGWAVWALVPSDGISPAEIAIVGTATDLVARAVTIPSTSTTAGRLAISPDGKVAIVTRHGDAALELGGKPALSIAKNGGGIGTVTSTPEGISCGERCFARFDAGTTVQLAEVAAAGSRFDGWNGECSVGRVTMGTTGKTCTATFTLVSNASGGGCFIATAAWGSPMAEEVRALRDFRDRHLRTNAPGRVFVQAYEALSPPAARYIADKPALRALARGVLWPLVLSAKHPARAGALALLAGSIALLAARRRSRSGRPTIFGAGPARLGRTP
jgi:DNA-binding beta-propeller fold protein YncE